MLDALAAISRSEEDDLVLTEQAKIRKLGRQLASLSQDAPLSERVQIESEIGQAQLQVGRVEQAIASLTTAVDRAQSPASPLPVSERNRLLFQLGVAYLRLGETQNCCQHNTAESCILPIRGEGLHTRPRGSTEAIRCFTEVLAREQRGSPMSLASAWLLNIAHMTLGTFPDQVPASYRLPAKVLQPLDDLPRFRNVSPDLGLNTPNLAGGAVVEDLDGDGWLDIVTSSMDTSGPMRFYRSRGQGTFKEQGTLAGLTGLLGGLNMVHADYNNDGYFDLLVLRGGWKGKHGRHPNSLLRNEGDGTFTDVTLDAGLGEIALPTQTANWADFDLDGDLDVYIGNEHVQGAGPDFDVTSPSQLFVNNGDGTFADMAEAAGVRNMAYAKGVAWGDVDGDRWPDLFVSNLNGENRLYRNLGNGRFQDMADIYALRLPLASFPCWFWDFNNDGSLDLMVHSYAANTQHVAAQYFGLPLECEPPALYQGNGRGGFVDVAAKVGIRRPDMVMGCNFGDLDNDGWLDCYLGTGRPNFDALTPSVMYHNRLGRSFRDVSAAGGFAHLQKGHGVAFADLDQDGDQDIFEQMGGAYPGDRFGSALYENPGFSNHWLVVELIGLESNRAGLGARLKLDVTDKGTRRSIYKHVNSGGSFGGNPFRQAIGVGRATTIERLEIDWPQTGTTQVIENLEADQAVRVFEGSDSYSLRRLEGLGTQAW